VSACGWHANLSGQHRRATLNKKILVAYTTKYGSTREVAEAVGAAFAGRGAEVDVCPVGEVETLEPYDAVVIGGPLFQGQWMADATKFLRKQRRVLSQKTVAIFVTGIKISQVEGATPTDIPIFVDPAHSLIPKPLDELTAAEKTQTLSLYLEPLLRALRDVDVVAIAFFKGRFVDEFTGEVITDYRNWEAIRGWSEDTFSRL
jgi:menaquinone-dependent protoporphyrinogen oxidase